MAFRAFLYENMAKIYVDKHLKYFLLILSAISLCAMILVADTHDKSRIFYTIARMWIFISVVALLLFSNIVPLCAKNLNKKIIFIAFLAMSAGFYGDVFHIEDKISFQKWQNDAESHIIARSLADLHNLPTQGYGLGYLEARYFTGERIEPYGIGSYEILAEGIKVHSYTPYTSNVGIQGHIWSFIYNKFNAFKIANVGGGGFKAFKTTKCYLCNFECFKRGSFIHFDGQNLWHSLWNHLFFINVFITHSYKLWQ